MRTNNPAQINLTEKTSLCRVVPPQTAEEAEKIRVRFSKTGEMSLLSHLELLTLFSRAVGRARVPIRFSQGFHPHPKFSFATALSVGVESWAEYLDMEVDPGCDPEVVREALNSVLPEGLRIMEVVKIPRSSPSLAVITDSVLYRLTLPGSSLSDLAARIDAFMALETFPLRREKKGKVVELDLRREVVELRACDNSLAMTIRRGKPLEFAAAITGLTPVELADARIEKLEVIFKN
jgi:radical SAM-linked protein